jgi:hypothetical protein
MKRFAMSLETRAYVKHWEKESEESLLRGDTRSALEAKAKAMAIEATGCPIPSTVSSGQTPLICCHGHIEGLTDDELNELIANLTMAGKHAPKMGPKFSLFGCIVILGILVYGLAVTAVSWMGVNHRFGSIFATGFVLAAIASRFFLQKFFSYVVVLMLGVAVFLGAVDALDWHWILGALLAAPLSALWITSFQK